MSTPTVSCYVDGEELARLRRELVRAEKASAKASLARAALAPGTSRARVTTANARWARHAEYRELILRRIGELEQL